ncbi:hypothetical protein BIW11_11023, partial [Tropilaelaps mercedesae]
QLANQRLSLRVPPPCLPTDFSLTGVPTDQRDTTRQADSRVRLVSEPVRSTKRASKSPQPCCDLLTTRKKKLGYMAMTCCSSKPISMCGNAIGNSENIDGYLTMGRREWQTLSGRNWHVSYLNISTRRNGFLR